MALRKNSKAKAKETKPRRRPHNAKDVAVVRRKTAPPLQHGEAIKVLDAAGIDLVCDFIRGGMPIYKIADELGVSEFSMRNWIEADDTRSSRSFEARGKASQAWDEQSEQVLRNAKNSFELAKAKELAYHYRWRASKLAPKIYGDRLHADITGNISLEAAVLATHERLNAPEAPTIEGEAVPNG